MDVYLHMNACETPHKGSAFTCMGTQNDTTYLTWLDEELHVRPQCTCTNPDRANTCSSNPLPEVLITWNTRTHYTHAHVHIIYFCTADNCHQTRTALTTFTRTITWRSPHTCTLYSMHVMGNRIQVWLTQL